MIHTPQHLDLPQIGLGTGGLRGDQGIETIKTAIELGYRLLDSAESYENEREVGHAVRTSSVPRGEIAVITKVAGRNQGYKNTIAAAERSLETMGLDYVDFYLIHWPMPRLGLFLETYEAILDLQRQGMVRHPGVSNFTLDQIEFLIQQTGCPPVMNEIERHPVFQQLALHRWQTSLGIATVAWSPIRKWSPELTAHPTLTLMAAEREMSVASLVLAWHAQTGSIPIPKSRNPLHLQANLAASQTQLTIDELSAISDLDAGLRRGGDPLQHEEY